LILIKERNNNPSSSS